MNKTEQKILDNLVKNIDILGTINDGVYVVDTERRILYWNHAAERITGYSADHVVGKRCQDNILTHVDEHGCYLCTKGCPLAKVMRDGKKKDAHVYLHHRNGYRLPVHVRGTPIHSSTGKVLACIEIFNLETHMINTMDRLTNIENQSYMDKVTKLPNWEFFRQTLQNKIQILPNQTHQYGLLCIEVDRYQLLVEAYGQSVADQAVNILMQCLVANCRIPDTIARIDARYLAVLLETPDADRLHQHAKSLEQIMGRCTCQTPKDQINLSVTVHNTMLQPDDTLNQLLSRVQYDGQSLNTSNPLAA